MIMGCSGREAGKPQKLFEIYWSCLNRQMSRRSLEKQKLRNCSKDHFIGDWLIADYWTTARKTVAIVAVVVAFPQLDKHVICVGKLWVATILVPKKAIRFMPAHKNTIAWEDEATMLCTKGAERLVSSSTIDGPPFPRIGLDRCLECQIC